MVMLVIYIAHALHIYMSDDGTNYANGSKEFLVWVVIYLCSHYFHQDRVGTTLSPNNHFERLPIRYCVSLRF